MNILECTIKMKQETWAHYERLSEACSEKELKRLFSMLAAAEEKHIEKLILFKNGIGHVDKLAFNELDESLCVFRPHIDPQHLAETLSNDPDAYSHVVQEEEETLEFLDKLKEQAENEQMKRICQAVADKEREHMTMLENIYLYVEEPRTYLEWGEFSNMKSL
ncbi:MAG: ferritin family protein [Desulfuromonadaceae bacterium]|nr:ferritin family protein [Desulfuromonadaceae bacterium]